MDRSKQGYLKSRLAIKKPNIGMLVFSAAFYGSAISEYFFPYEINGAGFIKSFFRYLSINTGVPAATLIFSVFATLFLICSFIDTGEK